MSADTATLSQPIGWLRTPGFDSGFILGTAAVAIASGALVVARPELFGFILLLDLWLLGYHHVVATYTRLCFDRESFRQNRFLVLWLPLLVLAGVFGLAHGVGVWTLVTIYLYWQWFHYTRQSWGVSQVYRRKEIALATEDERFSKAVFYLVPLTGILYRTWQAPETFLTIELWVPPMPGWVVALVGAAASVMLLAWIAGRARMFWQGRLPVAHTLYMTSHFAVFAVGYILIEDITHGWLVINIWHNAQYVLFVWLFNTNRFRDGVAPQSRFLSRLSQPGNWWYYFGFCVLVASAAYAAIAWSGDLLALIGLAPIIIVYQAINFHHYIVDSLIWKVRKAPMRKTLDLPA